MVKTDREAVVWTRTGMRPVKMGRIYLTDSECRFTYNEDFLITGLPGVGLLYPPEIIQQTTIVRSRSEFFDFLPPVQSLIPPRGERNFQRQLILSYLAKKGIHPSKGFDADWEILMIAGHGGIGHLDIFQDDEKAVEWYSVPARHELFKISDDFGFSLKEFLTWFDGDAEGFIQIIGATPTVGGAIPKLLMTIPESGWNGQVGLPSKIGAHGITDVILKFEQTGSYPGIIELEALALDLHQEAGFDVPRRWKTIINDIPTFVIERFDRDKNCTPLFTETLYSIFASGDQSITNSYSTTYDAIGRAIDRSPIDLVTDRKSAKQYLLKRLLLALATGNGDMHLENLSIINRENTLSFSPVYDPTPMRAYSIHNLLTPMPFGQYGEVCLGKALLRFTRNLGFRKKNLLDLIEEVLAITKDYREGIQALKSLPAKNRENLISIVDSIKADLREIK
ncbi:MAG TPA: type II toxin-antitoxin system HipA family toxin [Nitrospirae bacterium]|nr:type II toxin-antitoxin system HipA family toxin [Nitrospirota bacterium]HDZ02744.1 type II toxin-antitoxin system HipA family toxin [Nitrospirota bacterium]